MARKYNFGAELRSVADGFETTYGYSGTGGNAIDTTIKRSGGASYKVTSSATDSNFLVRYVLAADGVMYTQLWVYFSALPGANLAILQYLDATDTTWRATIAVKSDGTLVLQRGNIGATQIGSPSAAMATGVFHCIALKCEDGHGSAEIEAKLNGTVFASETNAATFNSGVIYFGACNNVASAVFYIDDLVVNDNSGSVNNGYPNTNEALVLALPTGAGDSAATTGIFSYINEIPPSDTATSGSTMIELDNNPTTAEYAMTDSGTLGIQTTDTITNVQVLARIREDTTGATNYALRIKSAASGSVTETSFVDCGNATPRTNPSGTVAHALPLISETDPTTGVAWTPTGTNSIDNMQAGVKTTDGTPDTWCLWLGAYIGYIPTPKDQTITGKARVTVTVDRTQTGKGRVETRVDRTQTGVSRVTVTVDRTTTGKGRVEKTVDQTISGVANIATSDVEALKTITGKGRITQTVDTTQTGRARVEVTTDRTQTGKGDILRTTDQTITGVGRVQKTVDTTITGVSRVEKTVDATQTGIARVTATVDRTQTGKAAILRTTDQTITGKGRIERTVDATINGVANISNNTDRTTTGVARITVTVDRTISGTSRISRTVDQTTTGVARIAVTVDATMTGKARIEKTVDQTTTGIARVQQTVDRTIQGVGNISANTDRTIAGIGRVEKTVDATQTGKGRIEKTVDATITGVGNVSNNTDRTQTGVARVTNYALGANLVTNGFFTSVPTFTAATTTNARWLDGTAGGAATNAGGWNYFWTKSGTTSAELHDTGGFHNGGYLLGKILAPGSYFEVRNGATGYFGASGFPLIPGKAYRASARMKSENVSGSAADGQYVQLLCAKADGSNASQEFSVTSRITINKEWTYYYVDFIAGVNSYWAHLEARSYGHNGAATLVGDFHFAELQVMDLDQAIQGKSRITATVDRTQTGKGRVEATVDRTTTGLARIQRTIDQTIQGIARITAEVLQTTQGKAAIQRTTDQTILGQGRVERTVDQVQTGVGRIQLTTDRTQTGIARVVVTVDRTQAGRARIELTVDRAITGVAAIVQELFRTITGIARIQRTVDQTQSGTARITAEVLRTQSGKGSVQREVLQTISGVARIFLFDRDALPTIVLPKTTPPTTILAATVPPRTTLKTEVPQSVPLKKTDQKTFLGRIDGGQIVLQSVRQ